MGGSPHSLTRRVYRGGITLNGDAVVSLQPGMYVLPGANPSTKYSSNYKATALSTGTGVTFYLTTDDSRDHAAEHFPVGDHVLRRHGRLSVNGLSYKLHGLVTARRLVCTG